MINDRIRKDYNTDENGSEKLECTRGDRRNEQYRAIGAAGRLRKAEARLRLSCPQCMGLPPLIPPLPHLSDLPLRQLAAIFCSWSACIKLR